MAAKSASLACTVGILLATVLLPLAGTAAAGHDPRAFLRFPPALEVPVAYPRFSWVAAAAVVALLAGLAGSWARAAFRPGAQTRDVTRGVSDACGGSDSTRAQAEKGTFPAWGWWAVAWTGGWWLLAWTRFPWFAGAQRYTFFPLWLGFIITLNAMTMRRTGTCLMRRAPGKWLNLFAASAGFWWIFEWLNRFVLNWHYLAVDDFGPIEYAAHATLCFSTVLPAVAAVREWLGTFARFKERAMRGPAWRWLAHPMAGWLLIAGALAALLLTGARPRQMYPALWVAPLALAWGLAIVRLRPGTGVPQEISRGDWRAAAAWMLAALLCGFWWEMWNWQSLAKWIYTVPYVERWLLFEMPLLGYAGYLPFGLECRLVVERIVADEELVPLR